MVDVRIRMRLAPWIPSKIGLHVFMNQLLKIEPGISKRANNDIGTHSLSFWNVSVRVTDSEITRRIDRR